MDQIMQSVDWVAEYLEWSNAGGSIAGSRISAESATGAQDGSSEAYIASYLDWMASAEPAPEAVFELARREAALWAAMRAESDCVSILRRILEAGDASPRDVSSAFEALERADRLLEDERSAWHALAALGGSVPLKLAGPQLRSASDWPHALEDVAADLHALMGKVLELRVH
jgi:hypothetical protein